MMKPGVIILDFKDNVATVLKEITQGEQVELLGFGKVIQLAARERIPFAHKIAIRDILEGEDIVKYGYVIGKATNNIERGEHVHVHNVISTRVRVQME